MGGRAHGPAPCVIRERDGHSRGSLRRPGLPLTNRSAGGLFLQGGAGCPPGRTRTRPPVTQPGLPAPPPPAPQPGRWAAWAHGPALVPAAQKQRPGRMVTARLCVRWAQPFKDLRSAVCSAEMLTNYGVLNIN